MALLLLGSYFRLRLGVATDERRGFNMKTLISYEALLEVMYESLSGGECSFGCWAGKRRVSE